jgi:thiamine-monophosphate kinase
MSGTPNEFALISKFFGPLATHPAALGLGDDAAVLTPRAGHDLIVTTDSLTAGIHFLPDDPPNLIAAKGLRVNLSDLAAKGAEPLGYLLALALPRHCDSAWLECFARGLSADQKTFGVSLLGGDTTATPGPVTLTITALGQLPSGTMIRRNGARPGDGVYVSGTIGDAGAGLAVLKDGLIAGADADHLIGRYRLPCPQLALGNALRGIASAALDVSDGLLADLGHIAEMSRVRIILESGAIPRSPATTRVWPGLEGILRAATAGDDYEIAFTAASEASAVAAGVKAGVRVTRIGRVETGQGVVLLDADGRELRVEKPGFTHF